METQIQEVLNQIRPALQRDGGDVQFVDVDDKGLVKVSLQGACAGCPGATMTFKMLVEAQLKEQVPGVSAVVNV